MKAILRPTGTQKYIPFSDRTLPPEEQTVIYYKPLTAGERAAAFDNLSVSELQESGKLLQRSQAWQVHRELCLTQIERVENFPAGAPQPWPTDAAARETYLEQFDDFVVNEIGAAIRDGSTMPAAAGN